VSDYMEIETKIKDQEVLVQTLQKLGIPHEVHDEPQPLYGYLGKQRDQVANVIIRRAHVGKASNDLGFLNTGEALTAVISEFDQRGTDDRRGAGMLKRIVHEYTCTMVEKKAAARGYAAERINDGGVTRFRLTPNAPTTRSRTGRTQTRVRL